MHYKTAALRFLPRARAARADFVKCVEFSTCLLLYPPGIATFAVMGPRIVRAASVSVTPMGRAYLVRGTLGIPPRRQLGSAVNANMLPSRDRGLVITKVI